MFEKKKKKEKTIVEPPKSMLERLEYKIEKTKENDYHTISVRYKDAGRNTHWKLISTFLKDELEIGLPAFGNIVIGGVEYDVCGVGDDVDICQNRLNDFCKIVDLYDNGMIVKSAEYLDIGDLKKNYIMNNL